LEEKQKRKDKWRIRATLKIIFDSDCRLAYLLIALSVLTGVTPMASALISQQLINALQLSEKLDTIVFILIVYIIFSLVSTAVSSLYSYVDERMQLSLSYQLRYMLMKKCGELSLEHFEDSNVYNMITRLENEIGYRPYQTMQSIMTLISAVISFISACAILFVWKPSVIVLILLISAVGLVYYLKIGKHEFQTFNAMSGKEREAWYLGYLMTHDFAFKEIKLFNLKDYFLRKYWDIKEVFIKERNAINKKKGIIGYLIEAVQQCVIGGVIFVAVLAAYSGTLLLGNVITYINAVGLIRSNTNTVINSVYAMYNNSFYMKLFEEFVSLRLEKSEVAKDEGIYIKEVNTIEFKNVSFSYGNNAKVLDNVSFEINASETIAIIGKNGSGKSTLLKLLCGLYSNYSGQILVNGIDLKRINMKQYRNCLSVMFQDFLKFEMTLGENISISDTDFCEDTENARKAMSMADIDFFDSADDTVLDKQLGNWFDDGMQLSGGQWQKIALARTYYRDRGVYLLDEPSSSLDADAELNIFDKFYRLAENKIGVFITHKISAAKKAEKIIVLNRGKVEGIGDDQFLSRSCDEYIDLKQKEQHQYA